jgi:hypothetical protein
LQFNPYYEKNDGVQGWYFFFYFLNNLWYNFFSVIYLIKIKKKLLATLPLPLPSQLDKWTSLEVFRYFKNKAIALSILDKELNIFVEERITGKHLIEITVHILKLAGFSIGSSMNIIAEIKRMKSMLLFINYHSLLELEF